MQLILGKWRGLGTLVTDERARRLLWMGADGDLHDALGPVTSSPLGEVFVELDDLVLVIGEWLVLAAERVGKILLANVHPELRDRIYALVPSVFELSEDDEDHLALS
jgi:hypothetical protein